jgi:hypothetical protein
MNRAKYIPCGTIRRRAFRSYSRGIALFLLGFVIYNLVIWHFFTEEFLTDKYQGGDLTRIGFIQGSKQPRINRDDLPRRHIEEADYRNQRIDLVTIGDSFSNGWGGGRNCYYQDYAASINNFEVLNLNIFNGIDYITTISAYCNNGYLDKIRPRYLLIGSTEKFCIERFSTRIDFDAVAIPLHHERGSKTDYKIKTPAVPIINEANFKFLINKILYRFSDHAFYGSTYVKEISRPLFSVRNDKLLLFHRQDLRRIGDANRVTIARLNDNMNKLAEKLGRKGIKLYFMPSVSKYNLYSEFIVDNRYPQSTFFEELRVLPKKYILIDTKAILLAEVRKGEKDMFHADDTHWSWKSSKKIFETVKFD